MREKSVCLYVGHSGLVMCSGHLKKRKSYKSIKKQFKDIDNSKGDPSVDSLEKIDEFYNNPGKIAPLLKDNSILLRKAHLMNNINEKGIFKDVLIVFLSALLSVVFSKIFDAAVSYCETGEIGFLWWYVCGAAAIIATAVIAIFGSFEKKDKEIDRYEVSIIDKTIENRIEILSKA